MNKAALRDQILVQLQIDLATQAGAAHLARDEAISEESRAESKYDTHGQEAAYLAEGQARIAADIQASIVFYQTFSPVAFAPNAPIGIGAVVELISQRKSTWYFIGARHGGMEISFEGKPFLVLTPQSPLGRQLLGKTAGATVSTSYRGVLVQHKIVSVR